MVRLLLCTRMKVCSNSSSMMLMLISMTAPMHPCKNLWKKLLAPCPSKKLLMSLLLLCQQRSRKWTEVRLSNHLALPKRILLLFNLLVTLKRLLKPLLNRRKRTIRASKPNKTLLQLNKSSPLNPVMRSKKKLSLVQKLQLPNNNEMNYFRTYGIEI